MDRRADGRTDKPSQRCEDASTGVLILQNAHQLFRPHTLARTNYQAELAEILHGTLLCDSILRGLVAGITLEDKHAFSNDG